MSDIKDVHELAEIDYIAGMKYKEIAKKYDVKIDTVKSWKQRYSWQREKPQKVCTQKSQTKKVCASKNYVEKDTTNNVKKSKNKEGPAENQEILDKQDLFCLYYVRCFNATKAYLKAYGCSYDAAAKSGSRLLKNEEIQEKIRQLQQSNLSRTMIKEEDIFQRYVDIAYADATDFSDGTVMSSYSIGKVTSTKVDRMKALDYLSKHINSDEDGGKTFAGVPANMVSPSFSRTLFDIELENHLEYIFPGGRGSTKSSFISLMIIDLLEKNPEMHCVALRQVGDTLRGSVFAQLNWAIATLGLEDEYKSTISPLQIVKKKTKQTIFFRGADDPKKVKSIKTKSGYIGILWFEELDQFQGSEAVRNIEQSVIRGGDKAYIFKSFNPPKTMNSWANKYIKIPKETRLVVPSTYLDVPKHWLGKPFLDEAEFLKETNPEAYNNEYLGEANGSGGMVFDNVTIREVTDDEIEQFDNVLNGVDWGWFPDLYAFVRCQYQPAQHRLIIFQEYTCNKKKNRQTADKLLELGVTPNDLITCDSAEEKSVADYKAYGLCARSADKGPGSRTYSYKWLQSLAEIVIDNRRCPIAADEFLNYEYERDKEGNIITGYPDGNDHVIDAIRYATNRIWKRRGE